MAKPRIWGHCAAGCEWEVPHKGDFDAYRKMASLFPEPTYNKDRKLTESGYYYLEYKSIGGNAPFPRWAVGVFYWKQGEEMCLPAFGITSVGTSAVNLLCTHISADGVISLTGTNIGATVEASLDYTGTGSVQVYTAQIVVGELPELAEGEAY